MGVGTRLVITFGSPYESLACLTQPQYNCIQSAFHTDMLRSTIQALLQDMVQNTLASVFQGLEKEMYCCLCSYFDHVRVRNDLGADSPNWRDHSKELQKKTAEPLSCSQFLSNGRILIMVTR